MVIDCKDSFVLAADLQNPECRREVLLELSRQLGIEAIVLSHYREKQYGRATVALLSRILDLARLLDRLSARAPAPNFPRVPRREVAAKCAACPFNPQTLYSHWRNDLLDDFGRFYDSFTATVEKLQGYREPGCRACTAATHEDLIFLFRRTVEFGECAVRGADEEPGGRH